MPFPNITANQELADDFLPLLEAFLLARYDNTLNGKKGRRLTAIENRLYHLLNSLWDRYQILRTPDHGVPMLFIIKYVDLFIESANKNELDYDEGDIIDYKDNHSIELPLIMGTIGGPAFDLTRKVQVSSTIDLFILIAFYIQEPAKKASFII